MTAKNAGRFLRRGQSMVELALIMPVIVLILLAGADFGRLFYLSVAVNNAARAGAQYGVQNTGDASDTSPSGGIVKAANNDATNISGFSATASEFCQCPGGTPTGTSDSTVTCPAGGAPPCSDMRVYVQVNTSATFTPLVSWPGIPSAVAVTGSAQMREQ